MPEGESHSSAMDVTAQVVSVAVAVLGTAGYVLVLGAAVLWLRLHDAQLPTEIPLSLASRQELIVMGAQALALWLLLAGVLGVLAVRRMGNDAEERRLALPTFALGVALTAAVLYAHGASVPWWVPIMVFVPAAVLFVGGIVVYRPPTNALSMLAPFAVGAALVWGIFQLAGDNRWGTLLGAGVTIAVVLLGVPALREARLRREANQAALEHLERLLSSASAADEALEHPATVNALIADLRRRLGATAKTAGSSLRASLRWIALGAGALFALGAVAVASQLDSDHDFRGIVVNLMSGRCLEGTYLTRDDTHLVLADRTPRRAVVIPVKAVRTSQLNGWRDDVQELRVVPCLRKDRILVPGSSAPASTTPTSTSQDVSARPVSRSVPRSGTATQAR